ncbi:MAG TPA: succinate dehydrogenase, hydrophobic membrane anchor protein [Candidatus Competibacter phosphatis]|jgi:succinate dehydrogenase / fumarate reductase membrane anchor subunit|uniref:Succinate dehydrogenase hydrophobic membrane anchor subunit n=1 Tax=Candidatus Competibacter phosphatis TaxID=221280 RepID=A0ABX1TR91_9GAMM|nr:succinate dehydrogenase, hydrophobic membrane anchor protein [Candidatus Competibacter phosphatis]MCB1795319.1 succinate dehydrogenase, hydrophobic membrane anchor protein [Candidatus Competibacteraceae bacterium]MCP5449102.1 succinate dehydrogenase, hydrophobic membrane anchor protein [Gammaproteobacteria bacterium]MDG4559951.1 succinate dehydrogenase, hydrophobic membrane anchor protein [Candidatus Competibacter sp.]NMQ20445.1 succinate dehydrogenase, hydrophobic membrane anchor protein [C
MSIRTPLAHARGLGTAKDGTHHWWLQRVTSVALVPLVLWFAFSLLSVSHADYEGFQHWLSNPINAGLMIALVLTAFYHANLGMQVIYEDYVQPEWAKYTALLVTQFVLFLLGIIAVVAVLKVALA